MIIKIFSLRVSIGGFRRQFTSKKRCVSPVKPKNRLRWDMNQKIPVK